MRSRITVPFKRKREGMTNYRRRLSMLKGGFPRAVVRKSLKNITIQVITFDPKGDKIILHADSKELPKFGWPIGGGNIPAAYLTGYLLGTRAKKNDLNNIVLDIGLNVSTKGNRMYAALKGMLDAGLQIPHSKECLPEESRIIGKHIQEYAENNTDQFSGYQKAGVSLTAFEQYVTKTKQQIEGKHGKN